MLCACSEIKVKPLKLSIKYLHRATSQCILFAFNRLIKANCGYYIVRHAEEIKLYGMTLQGDGADAEVEA